MLYRLKIIAVLCVITTVLPPAGAQVHLGCFSNTASNGLLRNTTGDTGANGISKLTAYTGCRTVCRGANKAVFGLQRNGAHGNLAPCYCADQVPTTTASDCTFDCESGNECGGSGGAISVHTVCPGRRRYGLNCDMDCYCVNQEPCRSLDGFCANGCANMYYGSACQHQDTDECVENTFSCSATKRCENIINGSYQCVDCDSGYERDSSDSTTCTDTDECQADYSLCSNTQRCDNRQGSYECVDCPSGYGRSSDGNTICTDTDECQADYSLCSNTQRCDNKQGSYECVDCPSGYKRSPNDNTICTDINECVAGTHQCNHNCTNNPGSYTCSCRTGYRLNGLYTCQDIDECIQNTFRCSAAQICQNTDGSYRCVECDSGYERDSSDSTTCTDINECTAGTAQCNQTCTNNPGSYSCSCYPGYRLNGPHLCNDIDECSHNSTLCPADSPCINNPGSYSCGCPDGYMIVNNQCRDIDECTTGLHDCGNSFNYPGTFTCDCPAGFALYLSKCYDLNECELEIDDCDHQCLNTNGSYICGCDEGYTEVQRSTNLCMDIDQCGDNNGGCDDGCVNTAGSHHCYCGEGYTLRDGTRCEDVNECLSDKYPCQEDQSCHNTAGSYRCDNCKQGLRVDLTDNSKCIKHDTGSSKSNLVVIVAPVVVVTVVFCIAITVGVIIYRRRRRSPDNETQADDSKEEHMYINQNVQSSTKTSSGPEQTVDVEYEEIPSAQPEAPYQQLNTTQIVDTPPAIYESV